MIWCGMAGVTVVGHPIPVAHLFELGDIDDDDSVIERARDYLYKLEIVGAGEVECITHCKLWTKPGQVFPERSVTLPLLRRMVFIPEV